MNITKHNPNCRLGTWQLQFKIEDGQRVYRAKCVNCGATSPVTDTGAAMWNKSNLVEPSLIRVEIPEIT